MCMHVYVCGCVGVIGNFSHAFLALIFLRDNTDGGNSSATLSSPVADTSPYHEDFSPSACSLVCRLFH